MLLVVVLALNCVAAVPGRITNGVVSVRFCWPENDTYYELWHPANQVIYCKYYCIPEEELTGEAPTWVYAEEWSYHDLSDNCGAYPPDRVVGYRYYYWDPYLRLWSGGTDGDREAWKQIYYDFLKEAYCSET